MSTPFWIFDPSVFLENGNWYKVIPLSGMTSNEALNSVSLLVFYASVIAFLFTFNALFILIGIVLLGAIVLYYYYLDSQKPQRIQREGYSDISIGDTEAFMKHAYGDLKSCKENSEYCGFHTDTRRR